MLCPSEVGSSVRYSAEVYRDEDSGKVCFLASVNLTDCDTRICWTGHGSKGPAHMKMKIKAAIAQLERALAVVTEAEKVFNERKLVWNGKTSNQEAK